MAPELAMLLPFNVEEPDLPDDIDDDADNPNLQTRGNGADKLDGCDGVHDIDGLDDLDPGSATKH
ncbi:MAG: hypothetical protein LRY23_00065 [Burkholderiaceae bacterium]|nr:hypothetical protein [Burkholderiaceae bacterium]